MKTFVIAGNHAQARDWIAKDITKKATIDGSWRSISDYIIVKDASHIKGFQDPHGVFVGTWKQRTDIREIVDTLFMQCIHVNRGLQQIREEVHKFAPVKPTPKIRKTPFMVHINGVLQSENRDYVVGDEFITFTQAPPAMATISFNTMVSVTEYTGNGTNNAFRWNKHG